MTSPHRGHSPTGSYPRRPSRRSLLRAAAAAPAVALGASAPLLASCTGDTERGTTPPIPRPERPVLWPIDPDNPPIDAGGTPERDQTLVVYTYPDYIDPVVLNGFRQNYGIGVDVVTFTDRASALGNIRDGVDYDVYFASHRQLGELVGAGLTRPLSQSYIPNIANVWPEFTDPFYDQQWRYSVPYTVFNSGIAWRSDVIRENIALREDPFDVFWDPRYTGKVSVLDNYRTAMTMVLQRNRLDVNTAADTDLEIVRSQLLDMAEKTTPKVTVTNYEDLPGGTSPIVQAWSGDAVNARKYLPAGADPSILRFWAPSDGRQQVDNDLMVVLRGGRCPVAAHLFLDFLLDPGVALRNFTVIGYQPPQNRITPPALADRRFLPAGLVDTTVEPEYFATAQRTLQLGADTEARWRAVWDEFRERI